MSDDKKPEEGNVTVDVSDTHGAQIPVENYHFNVLELVQEAARRFTAKTGKEAKFMYGPDALFFLIDQAIKARAFNSGLGIPRGTSIVQILGMEMILVPGTCVTITHEALHTTSETPPVINAPSVSTIQ